MDLVHSRCAGLDVHKKTVVACVRVVADGKTTAEVKTFETTTKGLTELHGWLEDNACTHAVMESTGVYWRPVWHVLASLGGIEMVLVNARQFRNVPGRKSDVSDAKWLAELVAHGLVQSSFVPPVAVQELRDITRSRKQLVREVSQHTLRVQKVLETCNIKLDSVISNIVGHSGRKILNAIIEGETDPETLAAWASTRLKCTHEELVESLRGCVTAHHRFLLKQELAVIDHLNERIDAFDAHLAEALVPFDDAVERLSTIPGVSTVSAQTILAEIGSDMSRFPSADHLASWAGLCPRMDESAGKHRSKRTRKGAPWLKTMLVQCAHAAKRKKGSYLQAKFRRVMGRGGIKKAAIATAHSILNAAYYILRDRVTYKELGGDHFDKQNPEKLARRLAKRISNLGFTVEWKKAA